MAVKYYEVPEQFVGKTIGDLGGKYGFRGDILSNYLGINQRDPLTAGQTFALGDIPGVDPSGSTELRFLTGQFNAGVSPEEKKAQEVQAQIDQKLQQGKTESIGTLEAGKQPLKDRYNEVIASIKGKTDVEEKKSDIATSREFGKRGIPLTSDIFATAAQERRLPIQAASGQLLANTALQEQQNLNAIDSAIASIQQATSRDEVQAALTLYQVAQNAMQNNLSLEESARQFDEQLAFNKEQANKENTDPFSGYTTVGEGSTIFNLLTGQPVYTAPKTYKPTSSGGGNDPLGIL